MASTQRQRRTKRMTPIHNAVTFVHEGGHPRNAASSRQFLLQVSLERLQVQQPNVSRRSAGCNWMASSGAAAGGGVAAGATAPGRENQQAIEAPLSKSARKRQRKKNQRNRYLAMDCEMVGVGYMGQYDMLARVSIVNSVGEVLLDKHVKPRRTVTDYRTRVSGIRPHDIANGEDFHLVQNEVVQLLQGRILVGHGLCHDLAVLDIRHPFEHIRDTSRYKPLCELVSAGRTPSLKSLAMAILGMEIQTGEHNSVEDARAAMNIYNRIADDWEKHLGRK